MSFPILERIMRALCRRSARLINGGGLRGLARRRAFLSRDCGHADDLSAAMARLPPMNREALSLHYAALDDAAIAHQLGVDPAAARVLLIEALALLDELWVTSAGDGPSGESDCD